MQQRSGRFVPLILAIMAMAALTAPPSVFGQAAQAAPPEVAAAPANPIRIGLGRSQSSAELSAPGGLTVIADGAVQWQAGPKQPVKLTLSGGQIQVAGVAKLLAGPVRVVPAGSAPAAANPITYNRKPYRGEFEVLVTGAKRLSVINVLNLDEYLLGVVPNEMPSGWPAEALKAQAVAARTYAIRHRANYKDEGFDLVDTTMDQAYGGLAVEKPSTGAAVAGTAGQVVTYGGQLATTMYHSSSGGHTENNEIIYQGVPIPYLRGVVDYDNVPGNTKYAWRYTYTPQEFAQQLASANYAVGPVVGAAPAGAIGSSGRPSRWSVQGMLSSSILTAEQFRRALDLPSSVRTVTVKAGGMGNTSQTYQPGDGIYVVGADGTPRVRMVRGSTVVGASQAPQAVPASGTVSVQGPVAEQAGGVEVAGGGNGHAVGMSQWGAYGMATQGKTYAEILSHFYQGTKVEAR